MLFTLLVKFLLFLFQFIKLLFFIFCGILKTFYFNLLLSPTFSLHAYSNANWTSDFENRKFIIGFCMFFLKILLLFRKAKKYTIVSQSSTKDEYHAMTSPPVGQFDYTSYLLIFWVFPFFFGPAPIYCMIIRVLLRRV